MSEECDRADRVGNYVWYTTGYALPRGKYVSNNEIIDLAPTRLLGIIVGHRTFRVSSDSMDSKFGDADMHVTVLLLSDGSIVHANNPNDISLVFDAT